MPLSHSAHARLSAVLTLAFLTTVLAHPAVAQSSRARFGIGVVAGPVQFDMSGTGTTGFAALRTDEEITSWLVLEQSLGVMRPHEQMKQDVTYLVPELQLQTQATLGRVRPYLGVGLGLVQPITSGGYRHMAVGSLAGGARTALTPMLDLRTELRVNAQAATLAQWTVGLARRL